MLLVVAFALCWWVTGFDDTPGRNMGDLAAVVAITLSLPGFLTGLIAGFVTTRVPSLRRALLVGFAIAACGFAWFLYDKGPQHCDTFRDLPVHSRCAGLPSWKDALGAFVGAEMAILFQAVVAKLFAGVARKYPLRRPV